jgi:hypothetical protein
VCSLLAEGDTVAAIAEEVGVSVETLRRRVDITD